MDCKDTKYMLLAGGILAAIAVFSQWNTMLLSILLLGAGIYLADKHHCIIF